MSESLEIKKNGFLSLWQNYCDKKMECEALNDENERLRSERDELASQLSVSHEWHKIHPGYHESPLCVNTELLLAKAKGEENE